MTTARATIKDVASRAKVHASTVSRVLNPETRSMVSDALAEKVLRVADALGYQRNPLASGLRTNRSQTVGVLIPDLTNPIFPPIVRGIERTLNVEGYVAILADSDNDQRNEHAIVESMRARQVDGLILATAHRKDPIVDACIAQEVPLVLVNRTVDKRGVSAVINDDHRGIRLALQHLLELGHRRIAYIGGPQNTSTGYARYRGFLAATRETSLKADRDLIVNGKSFSESEGQRSLEAIIKTRKKFTAVLAANDLLALGCFDGMSRRGLRCPRDVSVVGFNDMPFVDRLDPPLTTLHIPHDELGVQSALLLLERIRDPKRPFKTLRLEPRIVIRGSTRAL